MRLTGISVFAVIALALSACGDDSEETVGESDTGTSTEATGDSETTTAGPETDSGTTGTETSGTESGGETDSDSDTDSSSDTDGTGVAWDFDDVHGTPNVDDDNVEGRDDWSELVFPEDDDVYHLTVPAVAAGHRVEMQLDGDIDMVRLWHAGNLALGSGTEDPIPSYSFDTDGAEQSFDIEFGDFNAHASLTLALLDGEGAEVDSATINLMASPLMMNHHLQPAEDLWVVDTTQCFGSNAPFLAGYDAALGAERVHKIPGTQYDCDRWYQDEPEYANALGDGGNRLNMVIDSIRNRGLDDVPEDQHYGPNWGVITRGSQPKSTYDSFGNLEATPPVTVDGVEYPYGRIYYGRRNSTGLHAELADYLARQQIQKPFEVDSTWLCVGHVDEWMSWVPDASSPKGFKMIYGDIDLGYEILEAMPPETQLPRYEDHGYATVGELLADANLRAYNEDLRDDHLLPIKQQFMDEAGLEESDFLAMPSLFERLGNCGGTGLALIPGMANLVVANFGEGDAHLLIPDPFLRTNLEDQDSDPLIEHVREMMPDELQVHFIDDWDSYHLQYGEVHCGTNVQRTPLIEQWWDAGAHLLEDNG